MMSETKIEEEAMKIAVGYAKKAQSVLHLYSPKHCSPEDRQWFKTIRVHSILDYSLIEPSLRLTFPGEDFSIFEIEDFVMVSFSVGYDSECLCKAIHDIHLFGSEMIALEIAKFASTETRIDLADEYAIYKTPSHSWRVEDDLCYYDEGLLASILETCPTLIMITDLLIMIKSIVQAHAAVNGSNEFSQNQLEWIKDTLDNRKYSPEIVSIFWPYDWPMKHRVYQCRNNQAVLKDIMWSVLSDTLVAITPETCLEIQERKEEGGIAPMLTYLLEKQQETIKQGRKRCLQNSPTSPNKKRKI